MLYSFKSPLPFALVQVRYVASYQTDWRSRFSHIQISNTVVGYCWCVVKPFIAVLVLYSSGGGASAMGSTLYWMGADMHGPRYSWSMHQASAMLLVPDIPLTDKKTVKKVYTLTLY